MKPAGTGPRYSGVVSRYFAPLPPSTPVGPTSTIGRCQASIRAWLIKFWTRPRVTRAVDVNRLFTESELRTPLRTAESAFPELHPVVLIMARTGLRLGEALLLQPGGFDFEHRRIF